MTYAVGDIVRIAKQPPNLIVHVEGEVGYITEIQEPYANVQTMKVEGSRSGCGGVPLDCLVPETGEQWRRAKAKIEEEDAKYLAVCQRRTAEFNKLVEAVATKYGVTPETARAIHQELLTFD